MGKLKQIIEFEKENMPKYQFNFLYKRVFPGFIFILGGAILCIVLYSVIHSATGNEVIPFIILGVWLVATFVLLTLFVIYGKKISSRLLEDKTAEFEKKYELIDCSQALENLAQKNIIVDNKLVINNDETAFEDYLSSGQQIPLDNCNLFFQCQTYGGAYFFLLGFLNKQDNELISGRELDGDLCSFFAKKTSMFLNKKLFELFLNDKRAFLKLLYKYNNPEKMIKHIK